jgi:hypothetical protein
MKLQENRYIGHATGGKLRRRLQSSIQEYQFFSRMVCEGGNSVGLKKNLTMMLFFEAYTSNRHEVPGSWTKTHK